MQLVSAALLVALAIAHLTRATRHPASHRRSLFEHHIGAHLRLVGGDGPVEGLVRRVGRQGVAVRVRGDEVSVPFERIAEVWEGRRLLARW